MDELKQLRVDPVVITDEKEESYKMYHVGSVKIRRGQKVFEYNRKTGDLQEADILAVEEIEFSFKSNRLPAKQRVDMKENCVYIVALNRKNAIRKLGMYL